MRPLGFLLLYAALLRFAVALPIYNPANGHYYEAVTPSAGITWTEARSAAQALSYLGVAGHLATITSSDENAFIQNMFPFAVEGYWLGAFQDSSGVEPDGGWTWVTGEAFVYTNWHPGEPNEFDSLGRPEDYLQFHAFIPGNPNAVWNDFIDVSQAGFIVEWDANQVPDGGDASLLIIGLIALTIFKKAVPRGGELDFTHDNEGCAKDALSSSV